MKSIRQTGAFFYAKNFERKAFRTPTILRPPQPQCRQPVSTGGRNDSNHTGEGFVNYTILPKGDSQTGDSVKAKAAIVFDINAPIATNLEVNIIDAFGPASKILSNVSVDYNTNITLFVTAKDDEGGSGVAYYNLFASENGGPFVMVDSNLTSGSVVFTGKPGSTYCFFTQGIDQVGNPEPLKDDCEVSVVLPGGVLPVTLLKFEGWRSDQDAVLHWRTASEKNADYFVVERSIDGRTFMDVRSIPVAGLSNAVNDYYLTDSGAALINTSRLYYRLRQVDKDGKATYSATISLPLVALPAVTVSMYPNPFKSAITISLKGLNANDRIESVTVRTIEGKIIKYQKLNSRGNQVISLANLQTNPAGVYLVETMINGQSYVQKVIKE